MSRVLKIRNTHRDNPRSLRILYVTYEFGKDIKGGIGRVVNAVTDGIKHEAEIHILFISCRFKRWRGQFFRLNGKGKPRLYHGPLNKIYPRILSRTGYDVVHFFTITNEVWEIIRYIKENYHRSKIVFSCHSILAYEKEIRRIYTDMLPVEKQILRNSDMIHVLHMSSCKKLQQHYKGIFEKHRPAVIPNGINEKEFQTTNIHLDKKIGKLKKNNFIVACLTRWSFGKGIEYLLQAVPHVTQKIDNVRFIIGGRKPRSWENKVGEYVAGIDRAIKPLGKHVVSFGWLDLPKRNSMLSAADIWVTPSLLEYFPYSILEPMICRVPIISSRFDGVEEIIKGGKECLLYNATDPRELAEKIVYVLKNRPARIQLAEAAYRRAKHDYSWNAIIKQYLDNYQSIRTDIGLID